VEAAFTQPPALPAELPGKNKVATIIYQKQFAGSTEILMMAVVLCPLPVVGGPLLFVR